MLLKKIRLVAYQLGEKIHLKDFKASFKDPVFFSSSTEIFIKKGITTCISVQNSGEVAFSDCDENTISDFIAFVLPFVSVPVSSGKEYKEDFVLEVDPDGQLVFGFNSIQVPELNDDVIKIAMLNVSQSVVLDYFTELSPYLLFETAKFTRELELKGRLSISRNKLMKFIGKALNTNNRIVDNLYFIDAPDTVWDNPYLSQINRGLSRTFKLKTRFREVEYTLKIIDNNLGIFAQLVQQTESKKLDMVIIILILFEIFNALFGKFF